MIWYHPRTIANWVTAVFTIVIAIATTVYVVFTRMLWLQTTKAADAATKSANAAVEAAHAATLSAEVSSKLHQPLVGFVSVNHRNDPNQWQWDIPIALKPRNSAIRSHVCRV